MTLTIRLLTAADLDAADAALRAAYDAPASRKPDLRRLLALQPDGWLLATLDGVVAGVGGAVDYGPFAYIGQVGVPPGMQRRGVGSALLARLLARLDARGCPLTLLDASEAGAPLYRRLGFVEDDTVAGLCRAEDAPPFDAPSFDAPGGAVPPLAVAPLRAEDIPAVVAFDAPRFGADRGAVLRSYLASAAGRAFVARDGAGRIAGFLFAQAQTLGPWAAATPAAAERLLARALALPFDAPPQVLVPRANGHAFALLERAGFAEQRSLRHMRRGGAPQPSRRRHIYGQASFALG